MSDKPYQFKLGEFECLVFNDYRQEYGYDALADNLSVEQCSGLWLSPAFPGAWMDNSEGKWVAMAGYGEMKKLW